MKNVSMTINSNAIQSFVPAPPAPPSPFQQPAPLVQEYSVSFSVRFDSEDEAIMFAEAMLGKIQTFKVSVNAAKRNVK